MPRFEEDYLEIARLLKDHGFDRTFKEASSTKELMARVLAWLNDKSSKEWLMIIDNVDDEALFFGNSSNAQGRGGGQELMGIIYYLPHSTRGTILITTRNKRVATYVGHRNSILIEPLGFEDSAKLLRNSLGKNITSNDSEMAQLFDLLQYSPLAISQAAAFMTVEDKPLERYLAILRDRSASAALLERGYYDPRRDLETPNALFLAWQVSFDKILARDPKAAEKLSLFAFMDPQGVPASLLGQESEDPLAFDIAMGTLKAYSFVYELRTKNAFEIHALVQSCIQRWLKTQQRFQQWHFVAMKLIIQHIPSTVDFEDWRKWENILPHTQSVLEHKAYAEHIEAERISILLRVSKFQRKRGYLELSYGTAVEARNLSLKVSGERDPNTLEATDILALICRSRHDYTGAEDKFRETLSLREASLGKHHIDTLVTVKQLSQVLWLRGKLDEAESLCTRALDIASKSVTKSHPESLGIQNELGLIYLAQQRPKEAEITFRRALEIRREHHQIGEDEDLNTLANLGIALGHQKRHEEAHEVLNQALKAGERRLGKDNPECLELKTVIANNFSDWGRLHDAKNMHQQVLNVQRKLLGSDNPSSRRSLRLMTMVVRMLKNVSATDTT
jgi:tetratricopeptide (TPR) repeat protein